ncbi:aminodeoxychorismate/anthranilate synthase component II [Candidatus Pacearchaeota archaeon]|nr:aminodeoxychorismate/anthranilate synthase component II [Candidatus Pacearchaeota archaeon]
MKKRVLFIDNFDSFTYNLVDEFAKRHCQIEVYRNNVPMSKIESVVDAFKPHLLVISPGPASPQEAGNSMPVIQRYHTELPIFGVCLGYEAMVEAFGGRIDKAPVPMHGKSSYIKHDGKTLFEGLENPLAVGRYHSLCATILPDCLEQSAQCEDINMAIRHKQYFVEGVLFHPESILTTLGGRIIENLLKRVFLAQNKKLK